MAPPGSPFFFVRLMQTFIFAIDNYKCFPKGSCVNSYSQDISLFFLIKGVKHGIREDLEIQTKNKSKITSNKVGFISFFYIKKFF